MLGQADPATGLRDGVIGVLDGEAGQYRFAGCLIERLPSRLVAGGGIKGEPLPLGAEVGDASLRCGALLFQRGELSLRGCQSVHFTLHASRTRRVPMNWPAVRRFC